MRGELFTGCGPSVTREATIPRPSREAVSGLLMKYFNPLTFPSRVSRCHSGASDGHCERDESGGYVTPGAKNRHKPHEKGGYGRFAAPHGQGRPEARARLGEQQLSKNAQQVIGNAQNRETQADQNMEFRTRSKPHGAAPYTG